MKRLRYLNRKLIWTSLIVLAGSVLLAGYWLNSCQEPQPIAASTVVPEAAAAPIPPAVRSMEDWVKEYGALPLADAHNHGSVLGITRKLMVWQKYSVDRVVLFGEVSKLVSDMHDRYTWEQYQQHPDLIVPFFSGINLMDETGLQIAHEQLEKGFFGIGEIAAASTYSPAVSNAEWKAGHPMDGILPQLYELCGEYQVPLLLHIDPPSGYPVMKLEEALAAYPNTNFIFGHANAYTHMTEIESLLEKYKNIYMDIFAGFTAFNRESGYELKDFTDIIRKYPDRFMLSTDSGYDMPGGEEQAIDAMYMMLDLLKDDPALMRKIAYDNLDGLIRNQPATKTQKEQLEKLNRETGSKHNVTTVTKLEAGRILAEGNAM